MTGRPYFEKQTTDFIKGIALIIMFIHHFFTFPEIWGGCIEYPLLEVIAAFLSAATKICVSVFCFLTGYFYYFNSRKNYKHSFKKITDLLIPYWCVFFILAAFAVWLTNYHYSIVEFVLELFSLRRPTMVWCWYVIFYVLLMLLLPILARIKCKNVHLDFTFMIMVSAVFKMIAHIAPNSIIAECNGFLGCWLPCALCGFIVAKYDLFNSIKHKNYSVFKSTIGINVFWILLIIVISGIRGLLPSICISFSELPVMHIIPNYTLELDFVYAPFFVYAAVKLFNSMPINSVKKVVERIGRKSMLMWFVSCAFFGNCKIVFQPVLYFLKEPIFVLIWGLILCYVISIVLDFGIGKLVATKNRYLDT